MILVERAELEKVLGEAELGLSGTVSPETAARIGHLTGAKVLVTGLGEGIMATLFVAFTRRVLGADELTYAWLISAQAVGGVLGGLVLGRVGPRILPGVPVVAGLPDAVAADRQAARVE